MTNIPVALESILDIEGSGFVEGYEDEKGDFEPTPLLERAVAPSHPGAVLRELYLPRVGLNQGELAQKLGVSRRTISMIVNESRPVTVDMSHRLARAFGTSPEFWLRLQNARDSWQAARENEEQYRQIEPLSR